MDEGPRPTRPPAHPPAHPPTYPVRDDQQRAAAVAVAGALPHGLLDQGVGLAVDIGGGLIQRKHRGILQTNG